MKRLLCVILAVAFLAGLVSTSVQAKKIGEIKDKVFTDNDHNYSMAIPDGWSTKIGSKPKIPLRLTLNEKSPTYPRIYLGDREDYAQVPTVKMLVDTCTSTVDQFIENLFDSKFKSKQKKFFMKHFKMINKMHDVMKRGDISIQGSKTTLMNLRQAYSIQISDRGSDHGTAVNSHYSGNMLFCVRDGKIYAMYLLTEYEVAANYIVMWKTMVNSLKFGETEESKDSDK